MKNRFLFYFSLLTLIFCIPIGAIAQQDVVLGNGETTITTKKVDNNKLRITVHVGKVWLRYDKKAQGYIGGVDNGVPILSKGAPDIQKLSYAINIPTEQGATARIVSADEETYTSYYIVPSLGNIARNQSPSQLVREKGEVYQSNSFYPSEKISMGEVYQVRNEYGQALAIVPFQYNPVAQTLKVYRNIVVEVTLKGIAQKKTVENAEWGSILKDHFINYTTDEKPSQTRFTPVPASGSMLIVTKGKNVATLKPFVKWKQQLGIKTYMLDVDTLTGGNSASNIKAFIQNNFQALNLSYIILVGDNDDIEPLHVNTSMGPNSASDISYGYVTGNDHYPDIMVGRFSATTTAELKTQIDRIISYEKTPALNAQWYKHASGAASAEGPGDDNEYDWEHMRNIRTKLMSPTGGFTQVGELYDGSQGGTDAAGDPDAIDLKNDINSGLSLVNYCGHGSYDYLVTTGFNNQTVTELTNDNGSWPLVWGVACVAGDFENKTCLGEQLLRQQNTVSGKPMGGIAAYFSSINQSWSPPMRAQDAYVDLLTASSTEQKRIGTLTTSGCMSMNDAYNQQGFEMTDTWILFGDPSVKLNTRAPQEMVVTHVATVNKNATNVSININVPGAKAVLYYRDSILSVANASSGASQHTFLPVTVVDSIWVTVSADNYKPYSGYIKVVDQPTGIETTNSNDDALYLYPNPAQTTISLGGLQGSYTYHCYSTGGALIFEGKASNAENKIDISSLAAGQYFLKLEGKGITKSLPFVKRK